MAKRKTTTKKVTPRKKRTQRTKVQKAEDMIYVVKWYLRGYTQQEIADKLVNELGRPYKLTQQQISNDLREVQNDFQKRHESKVDQAFYDQMAKYDQMIKELWEAWDNSTKPVKSTQIKEEKGVLRNRDGSLVIDPTTGEVFEGVTSRSTTITEKEQLPDGGYMAIIKGIEQDRAKLLDLYKAQKIELSLNKGIETMEVETMVKELKKWDADFLTKAKAFAKMN